MRLLTNNQFAFCPPNKNHYSLLISSASFIFYKARHLLDISSAFVNMLMAKEKQVGKEE